MEPIDITEVQDTVSRLNAKFQHYQPANRMKYRYYDGKQRLKDLGISIPPSMRTIDSVLGWPGIAVDVLDERLNFQGWSNSDLDIVYNQNSLDVNAPMVHQDAFIAGTSYVSVTSGLEGEPDPLISAVPPTEMVANRSRRTGVVTEACQFYTEGDTFNGNGEERAILFRPNYTLWMVRGTGGWVAESVDEHNLNRVQVVQMINRPRSSHTEGRSELTPAVRTLTDSALRTLVGSEIAREFYAVPQRWMMGAPESFFLDEEGKPRGAWEAVMGKFIAIEGEEGTDLPQIGQFAANDMTAFFNQLKGLAEQFAAEVAVSPSYMGVQTVNPSSADAIRMSENRLIKRAERRIAWFGKGWSETAILAYMVRDGRRYDQLTKRELSVQPLWANPATPTRAATADEALKMISQGVYPGDGEFVMHLLGLTPYEKEILRKDRAKSVTAAVKRLQEGTTAAGAKVTPEAAALLHKNGQPGPIKE